MTILKRFALNVSDFITNMATMNCKFSNTMLNGSDFVAKTIRMVKQDYKRATIEVFQTNYMKNLGDRDTMQYIFFLFATKQIYWTNSIVNPGGSV